jgi:hypothetical protein
MNAAERERISALETQINTLVRERNEWRSINKHSLETSQRKAIISQTHVAALAEVSASWRFRILFPRLAKQVREALNQT